MKASEKPSQLRLRIAQEAARLMVESGHRDYQAVKRKAASRLGASQRGELPSNAEIELARQAHQALFRADAQPRHLARLREAAAAMMHRLERFDPCLVGSVLQGTCDEHSQVTLHAFVEPPEEVAVLLDGLGIHASAGERRLRFGDGSVRSMPTYRFVIEELSCEVVVFPYNGRRESPVSPVDGRPMRRADLDQLARIAREPEP